MRWVVFIYYVLLLHKHSLSQPITKENENIRDTRQLDFGECCPCPVSGRNEFDQETLFSSTQAMDDCPCRVPESDPQGSSSILFPSAMRTAGTPVRTVKTKEDTKPLLHPEIDLASSVLETLREATNEDYQEALARDAIRDIAKISGLSDAIFNDVASEESRNIVSVIVSPSQNIQNDIESQTSQHVQESHYGNDPLEDARNSFNDLKIAPKPLNLIKEFAKLPTFKPIGLLHNNLMNMDGNIDVIQNDEKEINTENTGLGAQVPLHILNPITKSSLEIISIENDSDVNNNLPLKSSAKSDASKYPNDAVSPFHQRNNNKKFEIPVSSLRLMNSLKHAKNNMFSNNSDNLNMSPTNIEWDVLDIINNTLKGIPNFREKSSLENILEQTKLPNLQDFLKPKDLELLQTDIFNKHAKLPHLPISNLENVKKHQENSYLNQNNNKYLHNMLPGMHTADQDNTIRIIKIKETKPVNKEVELIDTVSDPSNIVKTSKLNSTKSSSEMDEDNCSRYINDGNSDFENLKDEEHYSRDTNEENSNHESAKVDSETNEEQCLRNRNEDNSDQETVNSSYKIDEDDYSINTTRNNSDSEFVNGSCETDENHCLINTEGDNSNTASLQSSRETDEKRYLRNMDGNSSDPESGKDSCKTDEEQCSRFINEVYSELDNIKNSSDTDEERCLINTTEINPDPKNIKSSCKADEEHCLRKTNEVVSDSDNVQIPCEKGQEQFSRNFNEGILNTASMTESEIDDKTYSNLDDKKDNCKTDQEHCPTNTNGITSEFKNVMTHKNFKSNKFNPVHKISETNTDNKIVPVESRIHENVENIQILKFESTTPKFTMLKTLPFDNAFDSFKESIQNTIEKLNNALSTQNASNKNLHSNENKQHLNVEKSSKINSISTQDSQKMSDSVLKKENEKLDKHRDTEPIFEIDSGQIGNLQKLENTERNLKLVDKQPQEDIWQNDTPDCISINNLKKSKGKADITEMISEASDFIINKLPHEKANLGNSNSYIPPLINDDELRVLLDQYTIKELETPVTDTQNILKLDNLLDSDNIRLKLANILNLKEKDNKKNELREDVSSISSSELKTIASESSAPRLQIQRLPLKLLEKNNIGLGQKRPLTKPLIPFARSSQIKPTKLLPSLNGQGDILGISSNSLPDKINMLENSLANKINEILANNRQNVPPFDELKDRIKFHTQELLSKPSLVENLNDKFDLTDLKSHAENRLNNIHHKLKSTRHELNFKTPNKNSQNLIDAITEEHDNINDKLRAIQIDFNDRLETIRNSLIYPTHMVNDRRKEKVKNKYTGDPLQSLKSLQPNQLSYKNIIPSIIETNKQIKPIVSQKVVQKKLKMPTAANVQMPKTIEVPKGKSVLINTQASQNTADMEPKKINTILENTNKQLGNNNPFKKSKFTVSFSTTSRPELRHTPKSKFMINTTPIARLKLLATEKFDDNKNDDSDGSALKFRHPNRALTASKLHKTLEPEVNRNNVLKHTFTSARNFGHDQSITLGDEETELTVQNKSSQSWPKAGESSFLDKIREAVSARRPKLDSAKKVKNEQISKSSVSQLYDGDMARAASENFESNDTNPLKENVSYRCRMICTRE